MKLKCKTCGWIGDKSELYADYYYSDLDSAWSNHICPNCDHWGDEESYEVLEKDSLDNDTCEC